MRKRKRLSREKPIVVTDFDEVYNRIMYRGVSIPSCESRRMLQSVVDMNYDEGDLPEVYTNFVYRLMGYPNDTDRRILLSEIVATWLIREFGPMSKDTRVRAIG
jgi:hypothetical protein